MSKHTPGPWFIGKSDDLDQIHCIDAKTKSGLLEVCKVWGVKRDTREDDQSKANAHLISAAPDLLEALENLLAVREGKGGTRYDCDEIARSAIAKAKGETK